MPVFNNILAGAAGQTGGAAGYKIERSLRFNDDDTAYLSKTFSSAGNRQSWSWSGWVKRSTLGGGRKALFGGYSGSSTDSTLLEFGFDGDGIYATVWSNSFLTTQVFRDPAAWLHYFVRYNGTNIKFYINGTEVYSWAKTGDLGIGGAWEHNIGRGPASGARYYDGYLADVHFIDGQALEASDFGEYDANGVWQPKAFGGEYNGGHNQSQNWTDNTTLSFYGNASAGNGSLDNIFNGDITSGLYGVDSGTTGVANVFKITFPSGVRGSKVRVRCQGDGGYGAALNSENTNDLVAASSSYEWVTIYDSTETDINYIVFGNVNPSGTRDNVTSGIEIDGLLLTDSDISVTDNSFHLDFSDNSSDAALGTDSSGNGNTWTVNNLTATGSQNGISTTKPVDVTGDWAGVVGIAAANTSGPYAVFPDGGGQDNTSGRFSWSGLSVGDTITVYLTTLDNSNRAVYGDVDESTTGSSPGSTLGTITLTVNAASGSAKIDFNSTANIYGITPGPLAGRYVDDGLDSPTNYEADSGNNGGNYATLNPLAHNSDVVLSNGNLEFTKSGNNWDNARSTIGMSSGKWYCEIQITTGTFCHCGILKDATGPDQFVGQDATSWGYSQDGGKYNNSVRTVPYGDTLTTGDIVGIAFDADGGNLYFYKNGVAQNSGTAAYTGLTDGPYFFATSAYGSTGHISNFGQRPFTISSVPTGYKALCTQNLDAPEITKPSSVFDVKLYTGNESTNPITSFDFSPDLVLRKGRYKPGVGGTPSGVTESNHWLAFDTVRTAGKRLILSNNSQEDPGSTTLTAFTSNGFTLGSSTDGNDDPQEYTAVCFDAGDAASPTSASAVYNKNQSWSGYMLTPNGGYASAKEKAFNAQSYNYAETNNNGETLDFNSVTGLTASTNVFVLPENTVGVSYTVTADIGGTTYTDSSVGQTGVTFSYTGNVTRITVRNNDSNSPTRLTHIKVDGKELIDTNITVTQPTLDSTYRANPSAGFSIVSYTGNQTSGNNVAHGLNAKPAMMWVKTRDTAGGWFVYHEGLHDTAPEDYYLELNNNSGGIPASPDASAWNRTQPTSSIFTIGNYESVNDQNGNMVAYLWSRVEGFSEFGHYIGTGTNDGPFIYTGFAPKFVLTRAVATGSEWLMWDKAREPYNVKTRSMHMDAESESGYGMDFLSNGFKTRVNYGSSSNNSNVRYLWVAFADNPFQQNGGIAV